jgi:hypothetical protein
MPDHVAAFHLVLSFAVPPPQIHSPYFACCSAQQPPLEPTGTSWSYLTCRTGHSALFGSNTSDPCLVAPGHTNVHNSIYIAYSTHPTHCPNSAHPHECLDVVRRFFEHQELVDLDESQPPVPLPVLGEAGVIHLTASRRRRHHGPCGPQPLSVQHRKCTPSGMRLVGDAGQGQKACQHAAGIWVLLATV